MFWAARLSQRTSGNASRASFMEDGGDDEDGLESGLGCHPFQHHEEGGQLWSSPKPGSRPSTGSHTLSLPAPVFKPLAAPSVSRAPSHGRPTAAVAPPPSRESEPAFAVPSNLHAGFSRSTLSSRGLPLPTQAAAGPSSHPYILVSRPFAGASSRAEAPPSPGRRAQAAAKLARRPPQPSVERHALSDLTNPALHPSLAISNFHEDFDIDVCSLSSSHGHAQEPRGAISNPYPATGQSQYPSAVLRPIPGPTGTFRSSHHDDSAMDTADGDFYEDTLFLGPAGSYAHHSVAPTPRRELGMGFHDSGLHLDANLLKTPALSPSMKKYQASPTPLQLGGLSPGRMGPFSPIDTLGKSLASPYPPTFHLGSPIFSASPLRLSSSPWPR